MSFLKRAWLYITRKKMKTFIIFSILLCMSTAMLSGIAIRESTNRTSGEVQQKLSAGFILQNNILYNMGTSRGGGNIPADFIDAIQELPGVETSVRRMMVLANLENAKALRLPYRSEFDEEMQSIFGEFVTLEGTDNSSMNRKFLSDTLTLTKGRHLTRDDKFKALVHEDFAAQNNLKIGDKVKLKANINDPDNLLRSTAEAETEIIGLFSGKNIQNAGTQQELFENIFMTDLTTTRTIYDYTPETEIYSDASFFVKNENELNAVMKKAENLPLDWKNYELMKNSQELSGLSRSIKGLNRLVDAMLIFTFLFSIVILSLVLFLWINGRRKETGILMAVGTPKHKIILQYIAELTLIAFLSFGLSYFSGQMTAQAIGNKLTNHANNSAASDIRSQAGGMLGADAESSVSTKTLDKVKVDVRPEHLIFVWISGMSVIIASVCIASIPLLRTKPKELLSKMN